MPFLRVTIRNQRLRRERSIGRWPSPSGENSSSIVPIRTGYDAGGERTADEMQCFSAEAYQLGILHVSLCSGSLAAYFPLMHGEAVHEWGTTRSVFVRDGQAA